MQPSADEQYKNRWDERYRATGYAYGETPNLFFKEQLELLPPGRILMPADGEGRNGVYAAKLGWQVTSFDLSSEGRTKALQLAAAQGVSIEYLTGELDQLDFKPGYFDAIGLIYAHFTADKKSKLHRQLSTCLKPGGVVIFEAFSKAHQAFRERNPKVGGPQDIDMLFSIAELETDFAGYEPLLLTEQEIELNEGSYHAGRGSVIRFIGRKPL